jgi:hypothetical protein
MLESWPACTRSWGSYRDRRGVGQLVALGEIYAELGTGAATGPALARTAAAT